MSQTRPRYTQQAFPPYSYIPGHAPHPVSDPAGHLFGVEHAPAEPLQDEHWQDSSAYLYGIDLFNHGYYWEAHEAWESVWHAAGRKGELADFLKGLIKLAAAGVKAREGNPRGVQRHAKRAKELLSSTNRETFCGLEVEPAIQAASNLTANANVYRQADPQLLLEIVMQPQGS